jgi:O-antigen/teichoic acid export membrane protein
MAEPSAKSLLTRNTAFSVAGYLFGILLPFLTTPYSVSKLGTADWGVWVVLSAVGGWLAHVDFGLWAGLGRETAACQARGDREGIARLVGTWLVYDVLAAALLLGAAAAVARWIPYDRTLWLLTAAVAALVLPMRHVIQTLYGLQRHDLVNLVAVVVGPLSFAGLVAFLESGRGLIGVALNTGLIALIQFGVYLALLARLGVPLRPGLCSATVWRRLVGFGWKLEAFEGVHQAYRSDRLLLKSLGMPEAGVAVYSFGAGIADRLAALVGLLSSAVLPAATKLQEQGDRERLGILFQRGVKYHALAAAGLLAFAAAFADPILVFWLGRPYPESAVIVRWMTIGAYASAAVSCAHAMGAALGRPGLSLGSALAGLAVALLLYSAGGYRYHGPGLAACVSLGIAAGQVAFMIGFRGSLEFRWREFVGNVLLKPLAAAAPAVAAWAAWRALAPHLPAPDGRGPAFALLAAAFVPAAAAAWGLCRLIRVLDAYDVDVLKSLLRRRPA